MKTRFLQPARLELREAIRYYNAQLPRLGEEFRDEAWETVRRVKEFPEAWHPLGGLIRRCQMKRSLMESFTNPPKMRSLLLLLRISIGNRDTGAPEWNENEDV